MLYGNNDEDGVVGYDGKCLRRTLLYGNIFVEPTFVESTSLRRTLLYGNDCCDLNNSICSCLRRTLLYGNAWVVFSNNFLAS